MGAMKTRIWDDPVLTDIKVISWQGTSSSKSCHKEDKTLTSWSHGHHPNEQLHPRYIGGSHHHEDEELRKVLVIWSKRKVVDRTKMKS
jgi:hypothetical protein